MASTQQQSTGILGSEMSLFLVFLILKLCHWIDWSWWWVTSPLWIPAVFVVCILAVLVAVGTMVLAAGLIVVLVRKAGT